MKAQHGIVALVQKNKTDFDQKMEEHLAQLKDLCALLPPSTNEEEKKVKSKDVGASLPKVSRLRKGEDKAFHMMP